MSCVEAEGKLYLYHELTPHERERLDHHVATCATCQATMERISKERSIILGIRKLSPPAPDHAAITRRIMSNVLEDQQRKRQTLFSFSFRLSGTAVRYAMAALSFFLIVTFASEYNFGDGAQKVTKHYPGNLQKQIDLNSASFYKTLRNEKDKSDPETQSVYACLLSCLHTAHADCADCGNKFSKLN